MCLAHCGKFSFLMLLTLCSILLIVYRIVLTTLWYNGGAVRYVEYAGCVHSLSSLFSIVLAQIDYRKTCLLLSSELKCTYFLSSVLSANNLLC